MVSLIDLATAMVTALRNIPEVTDLVDAAAINSYIDMSPDRNDADAAIYQMQPGSILVIYREFQLSEGDIEGWLHRIEICLRAPRTVSSLHLVQVIMNGIPVPGDGMRWRYCPLMDGVTPTTVPLGGRQKDAENIDYFSIMTETKETGDA